MSKGILVVCLIATFFISGCLTVGAAKQYKLQPELNELAKFGIAIGRVTPNGITGFPGLSNPHFSFRSMKTSERIKYSFADYFYIKLPSGSYELYTKGTRCGKPLVPKKEGLKFDIEIGEIKYVGTVLCELDNIPKQPVYTKEYGFAIFDSPLKWSPEIVGVEKPYYDFYVIDEYESVITKFHKKYPQYKDKKVIVDLMH